MKPFNSLIYMSSLTEIISSAAVIVMRSQLKDYVSTVVRAKQDVEAMAGQVTSGSNFCRNVGTGAAFYQLWEGKS